MNLPYDLRAKQSTKAIKRDVGFRENSTTKGTEKALTPGQAGRAHRMKNERA